MSGCANSVARVVGLDAAAVEDAHRVRRAASPRAAARAATRAPPAPAQASRCCRCRWPRPARRRRRSRRCSAPSVWITADSCRLTTPSVSSASRCGQRLADADDRRDAVRQRGLGLVGHQLVALAVVRAALGVPDDRVAAAELVQHRRRHLAGVGALLVRRAVLRAPARRRCRRARRRLPTGTGTARRPRRPRRAGRPRRMPSSSSALAAWLPFIFQLPTTSLRRIGVSRFAHQVSTILPMCWCSTPSARAPRQLGWRGTPGGSPA